MPAVIPWPFAITSDLRWPVRNQTLAGVENQMPDQINSILGDIGVRKTLARLADSIFRRDPVEHGACYCEDGEWHAFNTITRGRENIRRHWMQVMEGFPFVRQTVSSLVIEVDGDEAASRGYVDEVLRMPDRSVQLVMGMYHSTFKRHGDDWLLKVHRYDQIYYGPPSMQGKFFPLLAYGRAPFDPDPSRHTAPMDLSSPD